MKPDAKTLIKHKKHTCVADHPLNNNIHQETVIVRIVDLLKQTNTVGTFIRSTSKLHGTKPVFVNVYGAQESIPPAYDGTRLSARCHFTGPKNSRIPGPNPLPLPLVMYMHASKTLCTGLYKS
jgi:hypothetical protein